MANAKKSSQKFIGRNRPPRVHIEYAVDEGNAIRKIELPFVMGVLADLTGDSKDSNEVKDRSFAEYDAENFDERLKALKPSVKVAVPNKLTGEGNLAVDLTFESLDDFSPAAIARKVEPLRKLLEARTQLENLLTYMDGREPAENLVQRLLNDPELLKSLAAAPKPAQPETK